MEGLERERNLKSQMEKVVCDKENVYRAVEETQAKNEELEEERKKGVRELVKTREENAEMKKEYTEVRENPRTRPLYSDG